MLAPVELISDILEVVDHILSKGGTALLQYARDRPWKTGGAGGAKEDGEQKKEVEVVSAVVDVYFKVFVPFVRRAFVEGVYGVKVSDVGEGSAELMGVLGEWREVVDARASSAS